MSPGHKIKQHREYNMHYYQFNIGDYAAHTRHLSLLEDLAYRRLLDLYYSSEKPLIKDVKKLARLLTMSGHEAEITQVLEDFFSLSDDGYIQNRVNEEIAKYHSKADSARANGKKGGRPKKPKANPEETDGVNSANPEETGSKAKQETITTKQEQLNNNKETSNNNKGKDSSVPTESKPDPKFEPDDLLFAEKMFERLLINNPNHKKPNLENWAVDIRKARAIDKRSLHVLWVAFDWANKDDFWCENILSPKKLREHFDKLTIKANKQTIAEQPRDLSPLKGNY